MRNNAVRLHDLDEPADASAAVPLDSYSRCVADIADRVGPAVVRVESGGPGRPGGLGSAVCIAGDGLILANSHVVAGARRVRLALVDASEMEADVLGDDPDTDLALLRASLPAGTPSARLGPSNIFCT